MAGAVAGLKPGVRAPSRSPVGPYALGPSSADCIRNGVLLSQALGFHAETSSATNDLLFWFCSLLHACFLFQ